LGVGEPAVAHGLSALLREVLSGCGESKDHEKQNHGCATTVRLAGVSIFVRCPSGQNTSTSALVTAPRPKCSGPAYEDPYPTAVETSRHWFPTRTRAPGRRTSTFSQLLVESHGL